MTCIVGLVDNGKVWMGADAQCGAYEVHLVPGQKVFLKDGFLIGGCGSLRTLQLVRYKMTIPKYHSDDDLLEYMVTDFAESLRTCLKTGGIAEKENERESYYGDLLVGREGRIFLVGSNYCVIEGVEPYLTTGSGGDLARGSLRTTSHLAPVDRIRKALEAANVGNSFVRPPFTIMDIDGKKYGEGS